MRVTKHSRAGQCLGCPPRVTIYLLLWLPSLLRYARTNRSRSASWRARVRNYAPRMYRGDVSARRPPLTREEPWRGHGETTFFKINDDDLGFDPPPFVDSPSARPLGIKSTIRWADRIAAAQFLLTRAFFLRRFSSFADISAREEDALKRAIFLSIGNDGIVKTRLLDRNLEMLYSYMLHRERCIKWFGMGINWDHFKDFRDHRTILETFNGGD